MPGSALDPLRLHHTQIANLLESLNAADGVRGNLLRDLFVELRVLSILEQQVFYPAVASVLGKDLRRHAEKELYAILAMMLQLEREQTDEDRFREDLATVCDRFKHHVHEQEGDVFGEVQAHSRELDLSALSYRLQSRKSDVRASMRAGLRAYSTTRCA
jgi:hypothetical protein